MTLSIFQNRARRPGNKRPPSRQKLREAGSTSSPTNSESGIISPNLFVKTVQVPPKVASQLEHEIKEDKGISSPSKKRTVTNFSQKNAKAHEDESNSSSNVTSPLKGLDLKSQSQPTPSASVFDSPPNDIFAPPPGKQGGTGESEDLFSSHPKDVKSASTGSKKLDVLLSSPSSSKYADKSKLGRVDENDSGYKVWWVNIQSWP